MTIGLFFWTISFDILLFRITCLFLLSIYVINVYSHLDTLMKIKWPGQNRQVLHKCTYMELSNLFNHCHNRCHTIVTLLVIFEIRVITINTSRYWNYSNLFFSLYITSNTSCCFSYLWIRGNWCVFGLSCKTGAATYRAVILPAIISRQCSTVPAIQWSFPNYSHWCGEHSREI